MEKKVSFIGIGDKITKQDADDFCNRLAERIQKEFDEEVAKMEK